MTTISAQALPPMTVAEFLGWRQELSDDGRYELVGGEPIRLMSPINLRHAQIQQNAARAESRSASAVTSAASRTSS